jgi:hypothetical protein
MDRATKSLDAALAKGDRERAQEMLPDLTTATQILARNILVDMTNLLGNSRKE